MTDDQEPFDERHAISMPWVLAAIGVPIGAALVAATWPLAQHTPLLLAGLVLAGAGGPLSLLLTSRKRAAQLEDHVRRLVRGEMARPLAAIDDDNLGPIGNKLEQLRRQLSERLRDTAAATDENERALGSARRDLSEIAAGAERQLTAVEETATSLHEMTAEIGRASCRERVLVTV